MLVLVPLNFSGVNSLGRPWPKVGGVWGQIRAQVAAIERRVCSFWYL